MKYEAMIKLPTGYAPITVIVEAHDPFEAKRMIEAQYKGCTFWSTPRNK